MDEITYTLNRVLTSLEYLFVVYNIVPAIYSTEYFTHTWFTFCKLIKYNKNLL